MIRYYIVFEGRVQGVGFRWTLLQKAQQLGLTGWVRNRDDERVEAQIQGEGALIRQLIHSLNDSRFIDVENYSMKEIDPVEHENGFTVRY